MSIDLRKIKRDYYTAQVDERDCGVAALNMVLRKYDSNYSLATLRHLAKTSKEGTTALGIVRAANKLDLTTQAIKTNMSIFERASVKFPFIAHVIRNTNMLHYYTVFAATGDKVIVGDPNPGRGVVAIPLAEFEKEWTGVAIFFTPSPSYQQVKESNQGLLQYIPLILEQKKLVSFTIIAALLVASVSILSSYFVQEIVDNFIPHRMISIMVIITIGLVFAFTVQAISSFVQMFFSTLYSQNLKMKVVLNYLKHVFSLPVSFFYTRKVGEITSRFSDASKIIDALASTIVTVFLDIWVVVFISAFLLIQNAKLFSISILVVPIYAAIILLMKDKFVHINQKVMQSEAVLGSTIIESIDGIETIKSLNAEDKIFARTTSEFTDYLQNDVKHNKLDFIQQNLQTGIKQIMSVIVLFVGALLVINKQLTVGELFTFNLLLTFFMNPLEAIVTLQPKIQQAKVANNRINEVNQEESEFEEDRPVKDTQLLNGPIEIQDLSFSYGYGASTLSNLNLEISAGDRVAIIGESGSGKTTLAKLLSGLLETEDGNGSITLNGREIKSVDRKTLRQFVSYVPQTTFILSGSIRDNLLLGVKDGQVSDADLINVCQRVGLADYIDHLPMQYDSYISESSGTLSGGQKQRLAIARALLSPAKVLIFNESTSNLDVFTEKNVIEELLKYSDKTLIFVAHRLNIAKKMDHLIVLDKGSLVESGTPDELVAQGGMYSEFINM